MFSSLLIANRGEIACRIARTARRMGLYVIGVYSDADSDALHVRACDEAIRIGPAPARESYLSIARIVAAARDSGAQCLHPGYGFLSENADLAEACAANGIVFAGPPPSAIRAMGLKDRAKALMQEAGIPVVPGFHGDQQDAAFLKRKAYEIGYPILIKAVAGGGGKGMRLVERHADFDAAIEGARREAASAFGDERVLLEKYVGSPRHIEIQVFADTHGNIVHLNERDCSLQRRHQKVIEEAPAPGMDKALREVMGQAAINAARAVGYVGAGTVEFIADGSTGLRADRFWFLEMNTRLQVEHPVTEAVTGFDLVEWQLRVAAGEPLPVTQKNVPLNGHAIEARVYAEDPERGFLPSPGPVVALSFPARDGLRIDAGVEPGGTITSDYDPMIAKVIAHAPKRDLAIGKLVTALDATEIAGPRTNLAFLSALAASEGFVRGEFDTGYIARHFPAPAGETRRIDAAAAAAGARDLVQRAMDEFVPQSALPHSPWDIADGFQLSGTRQMTWRLLVDGEPKQAEVDFADGACRVRVDNTEPDPDARVIATPDAVYVLRKGRQTVVAPVDIAAGSEDAAQGDGVVRAPMHGKLLEIRVQPGDRIERGQRLAIVEAMKMEHAIVAPLAGVVEKVLAGAGDQLAEGAHLLTIASDLAAETAPPAD